MTIDELKTMLDEGKITQEQIQAMKSSADKADDATEGAKEDGNKKQSLDIEKLIQQAVDRATNKLGNDNKKLRSQLETLKKEKLTAEELKDLEIQSKEADIAERERALLEKENRLYAIRAIKEAGLDDGSDTSLELVDFVMADDPSAIDLKIKAFDKLIKALVKSEVEKTFKENGRNPQSGSGVGGGNNPYRKDTFNLSEQMRLEKENPQLAQQLQALAEK